MVKVKDRARLKKTIDRLTERAQMELSRGGRRGGAMIRELRVAGQTIHFLSVADDDMPFAPAWCLTDDALVIGLMPQTVKAFLRRDQDEKTPADSFNPELLLSGPDRPSVIADLR